MNHYISHIIAKNKIDYKSIMSSCRLSLKQPRKRDYDISVIIGIRGRREFIMPLVESLDAAKGKLNVAILFAEHSCQPQAERLCDMAGADYLWIPCGEKDMYNRSLAFNLGYLMGTKAEWIMTHDTDCLVQKDFFKKVSENIARREALAIQPFNKNRVIYCRLDLTTKLLKNPGDVNKLKEGSEGTFTVPGKAMGGSLMINSELFEAVGMYDPELFTGYAPEDQFMWEKISSMETVYSADNPVVEIFHLHHEFMGRTNPRLQEMQAICNAFKKMDNNQKLQIIEEKNSLYGSDGLF